MKWCFCPSNLNYVYLVYSIFLTSVPLKFKMSLEPLSNQMASTGIIKEAETYKRNKQKESTYIYSSNTGMLHAMLAMSGMSVCSSERLVWCAQSKEGWNDVAYVWRVCPKDPEGLGATQRHPFPHHRSWPNHLGSSFSGRNHDKALHTHNNITTIISIYILYFLHT